MNTKILTRDQIDDAVSLLRDGHIVAVPTETVYGLAADATNQSAIATIFRAKGRPVDHPLIVHVATIDALTEWATDIPEYAYQLAASFWPGPLTLILKKKNTVPGCITGGLDTVAIRVPNHLITLAIITRLGHGIVAPSANAHKKTSPTKPEHVLKTLDGNIAAVIDGGTCSVGIESTIIDMTQAVPTIVRPGAITAAMIEQVLHIPIASPSEHHHKVPGNMVIHYQPETPLFLVSRNQIQTLLETQQTIALLHYSTIPTTNTHITYYRMPSDKNSYAQQLYGMLHQIDATDVDAIYVEMPPASAEWADVRDRLHKASTK